MNGGLTLVASVRGGVVRATRWAAESMTQKQRRFSFGIRWLLLAILVIAVGLAWLRHETRGRLVLQSETRGISFSSGPSPVVEISVDGGRAELESSIRKSLARHAREHGFPESEVFFTELKLPNCRFLMYDYEKWVRQRLDLARCRYVLDYNDPIARSRNAELVATIERVALDVRLLNRRN
jgi:hypothetical protein